MLWIKAFHIIAMVSWFAGLFYLPRLFVYHASHPTGPVHEQFCIMERKLYRFIMQPAMALTLLMGGWLAVLEWSLVGPDLWFHLKMLLVAMLLGFHWHCGRTVALFADGLNRRPASFYRKYNEIPTLILIAAVVLVVVRPF